MRQVNWKQIRSFAASALMLTGAYAVMNILGAGDAHAQANVGNVINSLRTNISDSANLVYTASYIGGTTALMMGAFKLKAHAENPGQTPMQQGLARLAVGAGLVALPSAGQTIVNSLGTGGQNLNSQQGRINVN